MSRTARALFYYGFALQAQQTDAEDDHGVLANINYVDRIKNAYVVDCTFDELWEFHEEICGEASHENGWPTIDVSDETAIIFSSWRTGCENYFDEAIKRIGTRQDSGKKFADMRRMIRAVKKRFGIVVKPGTYLAVEYG